VEKDSGGKLASLPPAKLNFSAKVTQIATGLQHTLLLTIHGEVYAFGSNNYGQLGLLDLNPRGIPTPVDLTPRGIFFHLLIVKCICF
jgi:alpha-tubulin suppressor-like RCC1 family protein